MSQFSDKLLRYMVAEFHMLLEIITLITSTCLIVSLTRISLDELSKPLKNTTSLKATM